VYSLLSELRYSELSEQSPRATLDSECPTERQMVRIVDHLAFVCTGTKITSDTPVTAVRPPLGYTGTQVRGRNPSRRNNGRPRSLISHLSHLIVVTHHSLSLIIYLLKAAAVPL
jgi:hypothetical protein